VASGRSLRRFLEANVCGKANLYLSAHDHIRAWMKDECGGTELVVAGTGAKPRPLEALRLFLPLLSPFAPHLVEELWSCLGTKYPGFEGLASRAAWPSWNEAYLVVDEISYAVQINGKVRGHLTVPTGTDKEAVEKAAFADPALAEHLDGKEVKKVIVVPGRLVNIVAA
jgi:leucyl-tRNA synthetase